MTESPERRLLREFYEQVNAIHGDDACDSRTLKKVRALLATLEEPAANARAVADAVLDNLPYLENLIDLRGHESGLLKNHPPPCAGRDFCLMRQAQEGADAIRSAASLPASAVQPATAPRSAAKVPQKVVDRFLRWPLPDSVCSDGCVTQRDYGKAQGWPKRVGTNLLTEDEARQMLEYVLAAAPTGNEEVK